MGGGGCKLNNQNKCWHCANRKYVETFYYSPWLQFSAGVTALGLSGLETKITRSS